MQGAKGGMAYGRGTRLQATPQYDDELEGQNAGQNKKSNKG